MSSAPATRRATLIVESGNAADVALLDAWFAKWEARLASDSGNIGCGCCIDMHDVEAPAEALAELPARFFATSEWSNPAPPTFWQRLTSGFR